MKPLLKPGKEQTKLCYVIGTQKSKFGRSIWFRFNQNQIFANDTSVSALVLAELFGFVCSLKPGYGQFTVWFSTNSCINVHIVCSIVQLGPSQFCKKVKLQIAQIYFMFRVYIWINGWKGDQVLFWKMKMTGENKDNRNSYFKLEGW